MNRLAPLRMNFARRQDRAPSGRIAALCLGAAALALAVTAFQDIQARGTQLKAELGRSARPVLAEPGPAGASRIGEPVKRANAVARELSRRWDEVFGAIEAVNDAEVALLAVEPDAQKGVVRITAESKNKNAMLRYLTRLQDRRPLQRVLLDHHEVRTQEPEHPVRFVLSGEWEETP
ncbi:MAG: hypothetical protein WBO23_05925 [Burkholderiales bacterium]